MEMGINPVAAHFFVFFFGAMSNVTPPVALASFTAAGVAGSDPMKTGWTGLKLTLAGFIIPFIFVYNPILLHQGPNADVLWKTFLAIGTAIIGVYALAVMLSNFLNIKLLVYERIAYGIAAFLLIVPGWLTDLIGIGLFTLLTITHIIRANKHKARAGNEINAY
ncbi:TRAP transporter large permease subunit [Bacillus tianshenii]|nr:TRAP transporter large permease subunit [Bacillus tianshenii]